MKMYHRLVFVLVVVLLAGCGTFKVAGDVVESPEATTDLPVTDLPIHERSNPQADPTRQPTATPTEESPTATPTSRPHITPFPTPQGGSAGWLRYTDESYGFTFLYPPGWDVRPISSTSTLYQHAVIVTPPDVETVALRIAFKRLGNDMMLSRTGVGAGELVDGGAVMFLGEPVERLVLVGHEQEQHITVMYGPCEIERDDMVFTLDLDCGRCFEDFSGILEDLEPYVDTIVASFELP